MSCLTYLRAKIKQFGTTGLILLASLLLLVYVNANLTRITLAQRHNKARKNLHILPQQEIVPDLEKASDGDPVTKFQKAPELKKAPAFEKTTVLEKARMSDLKQELKAAPDLEKAPKLTNSPGIKTALQSITKEDSYTYKTSASRNDPKVKTIKTKAVSKPATEFRKIVRPPPNDKCVKRLPQAIIVGIQKCGTTALLAFLSKHPQIAALLHPVEAKYFSMMFKKPLSFYRNMMPCSYSNQITIEKSPPYFYRPICAQRIKKMNPKTKIIFIVKDPIVRTQSNYAMFIAHKRGAIPSFQSTIMRNGRINTAHQFIRFSNYQYYMRGWLKYLKLNQMHFVDGHALETDPSGTLTKIENFLNIGNFFTPDKFSFNKTKGKYCYKEQCLGDNKGREHPHINKNLQHMLEKYFKPRNNQFFKLTGQHFDWGY